MTSNKLNQDIESLELVLDITQYYSKNSFLSNKLRNRLEDCCFQLEIVIDDLNDFNETLEN